jgi:cyclic pyranopterin phosphate synthase
MSVRDGNTLSDSYGRHLTYLRLSVTDRCNLRCIYCVPQSDFSLFPQEDILRFEEIVLVCRAFALAGIKKVRITGGEPLVRRDILELVNSITSVDGIEEVCLTTNGVLLEQYADGLYEAGVRHVNVSLDTLDPGKFMSITGHDCFDRVWRGVMRLVDMGFGPVKINCVVMKGLNDDEIPAMALLSRDYPVDVRFIEFMSVGKGSAWQPASFMSSIEARQGIEAVAGRLEPCGGSHGSGPARMFTLPGSPGRIGFISPLSDHFCASCNRLRLTSDGRLRLCLFSDNEVDIRAMVRKGTGVRELAAFFSDAVGMKPENYEAAGAGVPSCDRRMSKIGG